MERKTKTILISTIVGVVVLAIILLFLTFFVFLKKNILPTPAAPSIIATNTKLSIETESVDGAKGYLFKIYNPTENVLSIFSEQPAIYVEMLNQFTGKPNTAFSQAGIYKVACIAISNESNLDSKQSSITEFERFIELDKPVVNSYIKNNKTTLSWESINNATTYEIHINSIFQSEVFNIESTFHLSGVETFSLTDLFESLSLETGEYQIIIIAKNTDNSYFSQSLESNSIIFNYNQ